jgi:hypothetical protein
MLKKKQVTDIHMKAIFDKFIAFDLINNWIYVFKFYYEFSFSYYVEIHACVTKLCFSYLKIILLYFSKVEFNEI